LRGRQPEAIHCIATFWIASCFVPRSHNDGKTELLEVSLNIPIFHHAKSVTPLAWWKSKNYLYLCCM